MRTIKERAEAYAFKRGEEYLYTDVDILVEEAYEAGATEERSLMTKWHDSREEWPEHNQIVLVKLGRECYDVCVWSLNTGEFTGIEDRYDGSYGILWRAINEE